ncbi:MAG: ABC transporter ATP-binding protein [Bacteroidetes bacterium]|nr:ABC transporter ATP-binding protein [Bacteroidota bacterium]
MIELKATGINKSFYAPERFQVLNNISFEITRGEFISITGKSGCGKSTLLYILSTMDTDYEGTLELGGELVTGKGQRELAAFRNARLGFVFQFHYLLPDFTCLNNVMIPGLRLGKLSRKEVEHNAYEKLKLLGVGDQALKRASRISGGQQQRVAIARALINNPDIIMGDEPTGNLDTRNTEIVFEMLNKLSLEEQKTIITVTHDKDFASRSNRIIEMSDGAIINQQKR